MQNSWVDIKGFEGLYQVSPDGKIFSIRSNKVLNQSLNTCGYNQVSLSNGVLSRLVRVHRVVAESFLPNPHNLETVNHKDGNKANNSLANLEWCTRAENNRHAVLTGLHKPGGKREPVIKMKNGLIIKIYPSAVEAAKDGFSPKGISMCLNGKKKIYKGYNWKRA